MLIRTQIQTCSEVITIVILKQRTSNAAKLLKKLQFFVNQIQIQCQFLQFSELLQCQYFLLHLLRRMLGQVLIILKMFLLQIPYLAKSLALNPLKAGGAGFLSCQSFSFDYAKILSQSFQPEIIVLNSGFFYSSFGLTQSENQPIFLSSGFNSSFLDSGFCYKSKGPFIKILLPNKIFQTSFQISSYFQLFRFNVPNPPKPKLSFFSTFITVG
ncbi:UNKNOWN [Stylonychia lemnae]|uniref:Uncharacterized protein n=1 Tax=Stylonychia lemnae TaxID=5949 RepID=A0A078A4X4_STYLE|nr:UNKNOWN [Stylonychia lemnae]|eukprot:CDW77315.1 UNKNOWN [Stylonychia lemnae]